MVDTTSCPECGAPAEVLDRHVLESTDGPVEHARVVCLDRHRFFLPVAGLRQGSGSASRLELHDFAGDSDPQRAVPSR
jgi:hypothetical protein